MNELPLALTGEGIAPGEAYLADMPALRAHRGTQPDLFLRWNELPLSAVAVDVAVHLHGFSQQGGAMPLSEKVARSGLDPSARARPTLALLPRGNWIRHYYYDFPALLAGGLDALVGDAVRLLAQAAGRPFAVDRLILTGHSGGGMPAVDAIAGAHRPPDELHVFDGLYGRDPAAGDPLQGLEVIDRWLGERFAAEPARAGALRVVYIEQQTGPFSRRVGELIARRCAAADPTRAARLASRYRVEAAIGVQHSRVAQLCAPQLLAAADADIDWWRV